MRKIIFILLPKVHLLDLAGPVQVFHEADEYNYPYQVEFCALSENVRSAQGLTFSTLQHYSNVEVEPEDIIVLPGIQKEFLQTDLYDQHKQTFFNWLIQQKKQGVTLCSICTGAFIFAEAGLLEGLSCTSHWSITDMLRDQFPNLRVFDDCLFIKNETIYTSAGIVSGIDLALSIVEDDYGPVAASKVAREMVIYIRRNGDTSQQSIYLDYRTHLNRAIHEVQDWLIDHIQDQFTIADLADLVHMSPRNLTRIFKKETGITIGQFITTLRLELAQKLLANPEMSIRNVADAAGFKSERQFRRAWAEQIDESPSIWRLSKQHKVQ